MTDQLRTLAEAAAEGYATSPNYPEYWAFVDGFIAGRTSVTRGQIAGELSKHHFIHGIGRSNSCHCGAQVGEFAEYRNHEAVAMLALLNGENEWTQKESRLLST